MKAYTRFSQALENSSLPWSYKAVLATLLDLQKLNDRPKISTLSRKLRISHDTIQRAVQKLRELGVLTTLKGQRQNRYSVAANWEALLTQNACAETRILHTQNACACTRKVRVQNLPGPYYFSDSFYRTEKERSMHPSTDISTRENPLVQALDQTCEIYRRAGIPVPPKTRELALQLMISYDPDKRARCQTRLAPFVGYGVLYLWSDPQHTKRLLNVLRDEDWDVEVTLRDIPAPRKLSVGEQQAQEYLRKYAAGGTS